MVLGNVNRYRSFNYKKDEGIDTPNLFAYYYLDDVCLLDLDGQPSDINKDEIFLCEGDTITYTSLFKNANYYITSDSTNQDSLIIYQSGTYFIKSININECKLNVDSIVVRVFSKDSLFNIIDTALCEINDYVIGYKQADVLDYEWNTGDHTMNIIVNEPGTYWVSKYFGCAFHLEVDTYHVKLIEWNIPSQLHFKFSINDTFLCFGDNVALYPNSINFSPFRYQWEDGETELKRNITTSGQYTLTLTDTCQNSISKTINIDYVSCEKCVVVPNAFSPNNDGVNDVFLPIVYCELEYYDLKIYDRWGNEVFQTNTPTHGWNGRNHITKQSTGIYYYILEIKYKHEPKNEIIKGDITLIR